MEIWSHSPVKEFKVAFFFDTNVLCYLIDKTYPALNQFVEYLKRLPIIDLTSSEFVLLEFIGVRKREHYLRESMFFAKKNGKAINISSLLRYHNQYSLPEIDFHTLVPIIKKNVDEDKDDIISEFGIKFNCIFHKELLNPTSDICLSTKISKEDSLVLVSSIYPEETQCNKNVILLTCDADFSKWFHEEEVKAEINNIFNIYSINAPEIQYLKKIEGDNNKIFNLSDDIDISELTDNLEAYLRKKMIAELPYLYLGMTFIPNEGFPSECICFKSVNGKTIYNDKYVTIIGKHLDFVYNVETKVNFWNNGAKISQEGFTATDMNSYLSFKLLITDDENREQILSRSKEAGNLIFMHPHN